MFKIFMPHHASIQGVIEPGQTHYIRRVFLERLRVLREYYQERTFFLNNKHVLVRLLRTGLGSLHTDYETFVDTAAGMAASLIRSFRFTGVASYGQLWFGDFYGEGSYEVIIGDDAPFDVPTLVKNWKIATPIRVLTHAISDFGMALPDGANNHYLEGLAVIYINLPMLFLQYRLFIEEQKRLNDSGDKDASISPKLFLYRYVLPGMMVSHLDHVFINRFINLYDGAPMTEMRRRSNFFQAETGNAQGTGILEAIDKLQEAEIFKIRHSQVNYETTLANIFTITHRNAFHLLKMPSIAPVQQVWWALLLARQKHTHFLLRVAKDNLTSADRMYRNRVRLDYTQLLRSHVLEREFSGPATVLDNVLSDVTDTLDLAKQ